MVLRLSLLIYDGIFIYQFFKFRAAEALRERLMQSIAADRAAGAQTATRKYTRTFDEKTGKSGMSVSFVSERDAIAAVAISTGEHVPVVRVPPPARPNGADSSDGSSGVKSRALHEPLLSGGRSDDERPQALLHVSLLGSGRDGSGSGSGRGITGSGSGFSGSGNRSGSGSGSAAAIKRSTSPSAFSISHPPRNH